MLVAMLTIASHSGTIHFSDIISRLISGISATRVAYHQDAHQHITQFEATASPRCPSIVDHLEGEILAIH